MNKTNLKISALIGAILAVATMVSTNTPAQVAAAVDKILWCHCEPNGNCQTLELPSAALQNAGHMDASGNPLHAGDSAGSCPDISPTVTPTVTPSVTPSATPSVTPSPTPVDECDSEKECEPTPTVTPTVTPVPTTPPNTGGPGDGKSDGRSDGRSSCPECTQAPIGGGQVLGASTEGQVLGASTDYAKTGGTVNMLMNLLGSVGAFSTASGIAMILKKKNQI